MKYAIIAFDSLSNPKRCVTVDSTENVTLLKRYNEMRAAKVSLNGLPVVEFWNSERGFVYRYLAEDKPTQSHSKPTMKKTIGLISTLIAFLLFGATAQAQQPTYVLQDYTVGSALKFVPENTATNLAAYSSWIDVRKTSSITFMGNFKRGAAGTNTCIIFVGSVDGVKCPTNQPAVAQANGITVGANYGVPFVWTIPDTTTGGDAAGITTSTNFTLNGVGYIKAFYVPLAYDADQAFTNSWMKYAYKIGL